LSRIPPEIKPIALVPFFSATATNKYIGQEAADRVALELMARYLVLNVRFRTVGLQTPITQIRTPQKKNYRA
jgi:hypothetical protein